MSLNNKVLQLKEEIKPFLRGSDGFIVDAAIDKILNYHKNGLVPGKKRSEELIETAIIGVTTMGLATKAVAGLLLHEISEENGILSGIEEEFGEKIKIIVEGINNVKKIDTSKSTLHSENFIKLLLVQAKDVRALLILLAEKMMYLKYIKEFDVSYQKHLARELSSLYAPLAHRLGLYSIKTEMEEQSMKFLHNDIYKTIAKKLAEKKTEREAYIEKFIAPIKTQLDQKGLKFEIKGRPKSIHSIWNKLKKNKVDFDKIYDLFAIRIILDSDVENEKNDCWTTYSIVSDIYLPNPNRLRDWISSPKSSGYESLHTTVMGPMGKWVEVQIRTTRMDEVAEKGHAAHWRYKEGTSAVGSTSWLAKIREVLENPSPDQFEHEHNAKIDLYSGEIFIFTPNGDLRKMPAGATLLDFAYDIHTNLGSMCTGGLVNGKIVPIKQTLENGDKVEIHTSKKQTPKRDWLSFTITSKARSKIKKFIKENEFKDAESGKEMLMRKLNQLKVKFGDDSVFKMVKHFKVKDSLELYLLAANDKIDASELKNLFLSGPKKNDDKQPLKIETDEFEVKIKRKLGNTDDNFLIIDEKIDNIDYKLAKCCNPIHGDDIFGFVSSTGGIKVHRLNCPNAHEMITRYPYRIIKAQWNTVSANAKFLVGIKITGTDQIGIISYITQVVSKDMKVNMRDMNVISNDDSFECKMSLYIKDLNHLSSLLTKIKEIKGIHSASRIDL